MTRSGYAFVVKRIKRGQPLDSRGRGVSWLGRMMSVYRPISLSDGAGHSVAFIQRAVSIFEFEYYLLAPKGTAKLDLPMKADLLALLDGRLIVSLHEDWKRAGQPTLPQGSLVSLELAAAVHRSAALAADADLCARDRARPSSKQAQPADILLVHSLDNVNGRAYSYTPEPNNRWSRRQLELPNNISVNVIDTDLHSELAFVQVTGFLTPPKLMRADLGLGTLSDRQNTATEIRCVARRGGAICSHLERRHENSLLHRASAWR